MTLSTEYFVNSHVLKVDVWNEKFKHCKSFFKSFNLKVEAVAVNNHVRLVQSSPRQDNNERCKTQKRENNPSPKPAALCEYVVRRKLCVTDKSKEVAVNAVSADREILSCRDSIHHDL